MKLFGTSVGDLTRRNAAAAQALADVAKGAIAQASGTSMDESFAVLRGYARNHNLTLHAVSAAITDRSLRIAALTDSSDRITR